MSKFTLFILNTIFYMNIFQVFWIILQTEVTKRRFIRPLSLHKSYGVLDRIFAGKCPFLILARSYNLFKILFSKDMMI
ncbi:hypothetical protein BpHYR1_021687 [Brachionus plicatilis]|uniref:Uncharacterized protein n=1 Tax=Brachionus plicatilis TaxID=10195 RepID=A0A3M7RV91_BRAPC|nr:hypothetical protein BpHYR1_021687 [Brachionus plicatilis]